MIFPLGTYKHRGKKVGVAAKQRSVVFKSCINIMKMKVSFCKRSLVQWNIYTVMILWDHMWSTLNVFIGFTVTILVLHIDVFLKLIVLHCFYYYFSHQTFTVHIGWSYENVDILFVLPSSLDRPTLELYVIFVVEFSTTLRSSLGAPMSSQDARRAPDDTSRHSQGPPMALQGHPKLVTLWNSM